jgi:hypothetical protein
MKNLVHRCVFELSFLRSTNGSSLGECNYHIVRIFGQYSGETTSLSGRSSHDDGLDPGTQPDERHLAYEIVFRLRLYIPRQRLAWMSLFPITRRPQLHNDPNKHSCEHPKNNAILEKEINIFKPYKHNRDRYLSEITGTQTTVPVARPPGSPEQRRLFST